MKVLITGVCGFVGYHCANFFSRKHTTIGIQRTNDFWSNTRIPENTKIYYHDLRMPINKRLLKDIGKVDVIIHLAAMSHVDRSVKNPIGAVMDNVVGTLNTLEYARKIKPKLFIYFSTDEVFGQGIGKYKFKEWDRFNPSSPYSATKAAGEDLCLAYKVTYKVPTIIVHCMNIFGKYQHNEKFIPLATNLIKNNKTVSIYSDKNCKKSGSRFYIHVDDVCRAIDFIIKHGKIGEKYNIEGGKEITNYNMAKFIADSLGKPLKYKLIPRSKLRPENDFRYGIDGRKLRKMGWKPQNDVFEKLKQII